MAQLILVICKLVDCRRVGSAERTWCVRRMVGFTSGGGLLCQHADLVLQLHNPLLGRIFRELRQARHGCAAFRAGGRRRGGKLGWRMEARGGGCDERRGGRHGRGRDERIGVASLPRDAGEGRSGRGVVWLLTEVGDERRRLASRPALFRVTGLSLKPQAKPRFPKQIQSWVERGSSGGCSYRRPARYFLLVSAGAKAHTTPQKRLAGTAAIVSFRYGEISHQTLDYSLDAVLGWQVVFTRVAQHFAYILSLLSVFLLTRPPCCRILGLATCTRAHGCANLSFIHVRYYQIDTPSYFENSFPASNWKCGVSSICGRDSQLRELDSEIDALSTSTYGRSTHGGLKG